MGRLINAETFTGAQLDTEAEGHRLIVWVKTGERGQREQVVFEGDEADEALIEIKDLLSGLSDEQTEAGAKPARKRRGA